MTPEDFTAVKNKMVADTIDQMLRAYYDLANSPELPTLLERSEFILLIAELRSNATRISTFFEVERISNAKANKTT